MELGMLLIAEDRINAAVRKGEFDNLKGAGKPLPPDEAATLPPELRMAYRILKSNGFINDNPEDAPEIVSEGLREKLPENGHELLRDAPEVQGAYGRMHRLNALSRLSGKEVLTDEDSPYYARIVERLSGL
ncbi:DUF1992 domain-containing protein [Pseudodesulfovibrio senegalensis]|jgi:hypothetical protein|uniref:DUF1992 domain-containing protein n=2 Tax=Pseudodesulfovibrio senegalensis TaxID=1721087 RepID=A0A6N6MZU8_9BACT|nr:DUF1992 domain-containing protein [Pseudodesulfovibrio senegalensis]